MKVYDSRDLRIGMLSIVKEQLEVVADKKGWYGYKGSFHKLEPGEYTLKMRQDLRGIIYLKGEYEDLIYQNKNYKYLNEKGTILTPRIGIVEEASLRPLIDYMGVESLNDRQIFDLYFNILTNKKWLSKYGYLFGADYKYYGPLKMTFSLQYTKAVLPRPLGDLLNDINNSKAKNVVCELENMDSKTLVKKFK